MLKYPRFIHLAHLNAFKSTPIIFFSCTTFKRRRILDNTTAFTTLTDIWKKSAEHNGWFVGYYLLMPDHVHFFARPVSNADPKSHWVQMWKSVSSRRLAKALSLETPVWQEDYFDRYLRSCENYSDKWNYVCANPVRAGLVPDSGEWKFKGVMNDLQF